MQPAGQGAKERGNKETHSSIKNTKAEFEGGYEIISVAFFLERQDGSASFLKYFQETRLTAPLSLCTFSWETPESPALAIPTEF